MLCLIIPLITIAFYFPLVESCQHSALLTGVLPLNSIANHNWAALKFRKGDILSCDINQAADHILLATSSSDVAHLRGDKSKGIGYLTEQSWSSYHRQEGDEQTNCHVIDTSVSPSLAVEKAREDINRYSGQNLFYDFLTCNCEHWVRKWAKGKAYSNQSWRWASSNCDADRYPITDSDFARHGAGAKSTNGDACYSDCIMSTDDGKYYCDLPKTPKGRGHCSPRRGTTYKGNSCVGECKRYIDYYFCYTDSERNWDYCGPTV